MKIETGYLYHIKDKFFNIVNDNNLMNNHENGQKRPAYFAIKENNLLWFIPLSSKVEKYKKIMDRKIDKFGFCNTILIAKILEKEHAILLQNAFPTIEKYIDHVHTIDGIPVKVSKNLQKTILNNFNYLIKLKNKGINLFFTDIDKIKEKMFEKSFVSN